MADEFDQFKRGADTGDEFAQYQRTPDASTEKSWFGGEPRPQNEGLLSSVFHAPAYGVADIGTGVKHLMEPGKRMQGAHEVISGAGRASIPFIAPAIAAYGVAPIATAAAGGAVGSLAGQLGSRFLGGDEDVSNLAGDVGGIVGGGLGGLTRPGQAFVRGAAFKVPAEAENLLSNWNLIHPFKTIPDVLRSGRELYRGGMEGVKESRNPPLAAPRPISGTPSTAGPEPGQYSRGAAPVQSEVPVGGAHVPEYSGPTIQPEVPTTGGEISGRPTTSRFTPGQYETKVASAPIEVGGAHIPEFHGPAIQPEVPAGPSEISGRPTGSRYAPGQYDLKIASAPIQVGGAHIPDYTPSATPADVMETIRAKEAAEAAAKPKIASPAKAETKGLIPVPEKTVEGAVTKLNTPEHEPYESFSPSRVARQTTPQEGTSEVPSLSEKLKNNPAAMKAAKALKKSQGGK